jgi:flagellar FliJ protein
MRKFIFRPQVLIDIQKSKVEQLQGDLADALRHRQVVLGEIATIFQKVTDNVKAKNHKMEEGMSVFDLLMFNEFEEFLILKRLEKETELAEVESLIEKIRLELAAAYKRQKTLEKFKEIRYNEYKFEKNRIDNRRMDEIGIGGFVRNT